MNKKNTHFPWYAVATAPRDYPMEVTSGTFFYKGQEAGIPIPSGGTLRQGWGESSSVYVGGDEIPPLPDRVKVSFFSYAEKLSYQAEFSLPYDKILSLFQQRQKEAPNESNYTHFLLGIAPGGAMSVWIKGAGGRTIEVFFGQAEQVERSPSEAFELPFESTSQSDEYIESALAEAVSPEQLEYIKTHGAPLGAWARFRNLYKWAPAYKEGKGPTEPEMRVLFLNGEKYLVPTRFSEEFSGTPKPLPFHLKLEARAAAEEAPYYIIDFEPFELMEAFEKLGANGELVYIELDTKMPTTDLKIRLYNDEEPKKGDEKEVIELKKFQVEPW